MGIPLDNEMAVGLILASFPPPERKVLLMKIMASQMVCDIYPEILSEEDAKDSIKACAEDLASWIDTYIKTARALN